MSMQTTDPDIVQISIAGWIPDSAAFCTKKGVDTSAFLSVGDSKILLNRREIEVLAVSLRKWLNETRK